MWLATYLSLSPNEIVRDNEHSEYGWRPSVRPEQKDIDLMKHLMQKFLKPGKLVPDALLGTLSVAKVCLMPEKHSRFVGYDEDG